MGLIIVPLSFKKTNGIVLVNCSGVQNLLIPTAFSFILIISGVRNFKLTFEVAKFLVSSPIFHEIFE